MYIIHMQQTFPEGLLYAWGFQDRASHLVLLTAEKGGFILTSRDVKKLRTIGGGTQGHRARRWQRDSHSVPSTDPPPGGPASLTSFSYPERPGKVRPSCFGRADRACFRPALIPAPAPSLAAPRLQPKTADSFPNPEGEAKCSSVGGGGGGSYLQTLLPRGEKAHLLAKKLCCLARS